MTEARTHFPIQGESKYAKSSEVPAAVYLRAYEVYCHLYGPQEALVTGWCRGGFSPGELIGYLYAHSFPREEWHKRADEAFAATK